MISYELAKKLEDVGFPEKEVVIGDWYWEGPNGYGGGEALYQLTDEIDQLGMSTGVIIRIPTLSELIEACGEEFTQLIRFNSTHFQVKPSLGRMLNYPDEIFIGQSPEEAVATLWLELNKK